MILRKLGLSVAALAAFTGSAGADITLSANNNATVQPAGPRTGSNGQKFLNIEGSSNNAFASFGVVDFAGANGGTPVTTLNPNASLVLTESDAAFTAPGALDVYLTRDTTTNDVNTATGTPPTSPLTYQSTAAPQGIGSQLSPNDLIGTAMFNSSGNTNTGQVDTYSLTLSPSDISYLTGQLNNGGDIRLIVAPADATVAGTFAGFTNTSQAGPQLVLTPAATPEPGSLGILSAGAVALMRRRRNR